MSQMPSPSELSYFIEVANTLNISRAAERLGISQPSLSLAIQRLEDGLGVPLLIRTKSGVKLTRGGQKFVIQARSLLHDWEKLKADALKAESVLTGRYTIGCHTSVALYSLPSILPPMMKENAGLDIKLAHDLSRKITEDVISFKVDFGIVVNPAEHPDLVIKLLFKDEVTLWTGPQGTHSSLTDPSSGEAVLICDPELLQTQSLLKQLSKKGMNFHRAITSSSLEVITALVSEGAGIGILPTRVATRIKSQGLKRLGGDSPIFQDRICLVYRADAQKTRASRMMAQLIESTINPGS